MLLVTLLIGFSAHSFTITTRKKCNTRYIHDFSMSSYPVTIRNVLTRMTQATQNALREKNSRMRVELPPVNIVATSVPFEMIRNDLIPFA